MQGTVPGRVHRRHPAIKTFVSSAAPIPTGKECVMSTNLHRFLAAALVVASVCSVADPLRQRAHAERGRTWVLAENGLFLEEAGKPRRPLGLVGWQRIVEPYSCPPDIAIGPGG